MSLNTTQQIYEQIKRADHILITFKKTFSIDSVASALALSSILNKLNKRNDIICDGFVMPKKLSFLEADDKIKPQLSNLRKFIISLDISQTKLKDLSYDVKDKRLNIFLTPKEGTFNKQQVSTASDHFKYDLIFTVDSPDLEIIGKTYDNNTEFFFNTPIINIDHNPSNEYFGQLNLIDISATSVSEILYNLFQKMGPELPDKNINTLLLTGIIAKTKSFRISNVTPHVLNIASSLVAAQADREKIIKNLYQTISISTLKLWGQALSRLKNTTDEKISWTYLLSQDFIDCQATEDDLDGIIEELIGNTPQSEINILFYEIGLNRINVIIKSEKEIDILNLFSKYNPAGRKNSVKLSFKDKNLIDAQNEVIEKIKSLKK